MKFEILGRLVEEEFAESAVLSAETIDLYKAGFCDFENHIGTLLEDTQGQLKIGLNYHLMACFLLPTALPKLIADGLLVQFEHPEQFFDTGFIDELGRVLLGEDRIGRFEEGELRIQDHFSELTERQCRVFLSSIAALIRWDSYFPTTYRQGAFDPLTALCDRVVIVGLEKGAVEKKVCRLRQRIMNRMFLP